MVVNPTVILGPGDFRRSSAALFRHIDQGLAWYPSGSGGYVGSEDVAEVCVRLGDSDVRNERFVLCADHMPHRELMIRVAHALGRPGPSRRVQPWMAGLAWRLFALTPNASRGVAPWPRRKALSSASETLLYDGAKIERTLAELGQPWSYTPLDNVILTTAQAYRREFGS